MATTNPITRYRRADRAIRAIGRNGGRTAATTDALHRWWDERDQVVRQLLTEDTEVSRYVAGLLTEESNLARRGWRDRPFDLKPRMLETQRELRRLEKELDRK